MLNRYIATVRINVTSCMNACKYVNHSDILCIYMCIHEYSVCETCLYTIVCVPAPADFCWMNHCSAVQSLLDTQDLRVNCQPFQVWEHCEIPQHLTAEEISFGIDYIRSLMSVNMSFLFCSVTVNPRSIGHLRAVSTVCIT